MTTLNIKKEIKELIDRMGFNLLHDPEIKKEEDDRFLINIFVDEPKTLIGERGINLKALEFIFRIIVAKKHDGNIKINLDINGYKQKRAEFLKSFALSARYRALKDGKSVELEPMNSFDRRIIHAALAEYSDVKTESAGETPDRRVVVHIA